MSVITYPNREIPPAPRPVGEFQWYTDPSYTLPQGNVPFIKTTNARLTVDEIAMLADLLDNLAEIELEKQPVEHRPITRAAPGSAVAKVSKGFVYHRFGAGEDLQLIGEVRLGSGEGLDVHRLFVPFAKCDLTAESLRQIASAIGKAPLGDLTQKLNRFGGGDTASA